MAEKPYEWANGAKLEDHSRRKHKILREYFFEYLTVRCQLPKQERFRLAVIDGFAGGGRYECGTSGSPLIFIEELKRAIESVNAQRAAQGDAVIPIPGTTKPERVEENAGAATLTLGADDLAELDAVPPPVGTRY